MIVGCRRVNGRAVSPAVAIAAGLALAAVLMTASCDGQPGKAEPSPTPSNQSPTNSASPGEVQWTIDPELPRDYREDCRELYGINEIEIPIDRSGEHVTNQTYSGRHPCANFYRSEVQHVVFRNFSATLALFRRALLRRVTFTHSRLHMSDFSGAILRDVEFRSVSLFGANFLNAKLRNVTLVDVVCPSGLNSEDNNDSCFGFGFDPPEKAVPVWATPVRVSVLSHCGVRSVWVRGELWLADPPLGVHNPALGWDENETAGSFVVTPEGIGTFRGDEGQVAHFRLADQGTGDPNAGCE